jgi:uncharacterized protein YodC (DUF2158 family)
MILSRSFQIGEIVRAKAGGPLMTFEGPSLPQKGDSRRWVQCSWFSGATLRRGKFLPSALEAVPAEEVRAALEARARRAGTKASRPSGVKRGNSEG